MRAELMRARGVGLCYENHGGNITIGAASGAAAVLLPGAINRLRQQSPGVNLRIIEGMPNATLPRVRDGSFDFALGPRLREPIPADVVATRVFQNEFAIIVRRGHPLASVHSLAALVDHDWITAGMGTSHLIVEEMFHSAGLPLPRWAVRCESAPGLLRLPQIAILSTQSAQPCLILRAAGL